MGFPSEYSGFIISKIHTNAVILLALIRYGLVCLLRYVGLSDFLEGESSSWSSSSDSSEHSSDANSLTADMIRDCLPVFEFGVIADRYTDSESACCAVCLSEFDNFDEIRQLTNCNHIFHSVCLDKWLDHDQKTCPLCRTHMMPEIVEKEVTAESWAVERLLYLFGEDLVFES